MFNKPAQLYLIIVLMLLASCKKEDNYSSTPSIILKNLSADNVSEGTPITLTITYTDGDGDLGENTPGVKNLFVVDSRVNISYGYRINELAPRGSNIIIKGDLDISLNGQSILNGGNSEQVVYNVYVVDRAGNVSNTVSTVPITITQ
ncbi:MAG: hypothetical protein RIQ89_2425 [Bacteroidota bacterium]|jgi:hypothetical protein